MGALVRSNSTDEAGGTPVKMTPEELAEALNVELSLAEALLASSSTRVPSRARRRSRVLFALVLLGGVAVAGVRSQILAMFTAVGSPGAGELVPRQIPYRGYLEENGSPVQATKAMQFRLLPGDGGSSAYWDSQSLAVGVAVGQFEVALGDDLARPIPEAALRDPGVRLEVSVEGRTLGTQRLLSTGFAQRALSAVRSEQAANAATAESATGVLATQVVPPGVVAPFVGGTAPPGWLFCDGAAVSRTTYANLFAIIGTSSGVGDGSTTFNLPDYRGRFLRGADEGTGRDPDAIARTAENGGSPGPGIGSLQDDALEGHFHYIKAIVGSAVGGSALSFNANRTDWNINTGSQVDFLGVTAFAGGSETRPTNVAVKFIVKY